MGLLILLSACSLPVHGQTTVKLCIPAKAESNGNTAIKNKCESALSSAADDSGDPDLSNVDFQCDYGGSDEGCLNGVSRGAYDLATFGGDYLFHAHREHGLVTYVAEQYDSESGGLQDHHFYAVAVVKTSSCKQFGGSLGNLRDLEGKKSCHNQYHDSAGWLLPIGYMLSRGMLPPARDEAYLNNKAVDARSASNFFSDMCAPGTAKIGPKYDENSNTVKNEGLCGLCQAANDGADSCSADPEQNKYAGNTGAFQCLVDGFADVAFVKDGTFEEWRSSKADASTVSRDEFSLLCNRGCLPLSEAKKCNLGRAPAKALVGRPGFADEDAIKNKVLNLFADDEDLFGALQTINDQPDFVWSDEASGVRKIEHPSSFYGATGFFKDYNQYDAVHALNEISICLPFSSTTDCTQIFEEQADTIKSNMSTQAPVSIRCNARGSNEACMRAVQRGVIRGGDDFSVFGGDELYTAHEYYGLNAYAAEKDDKQAAGELNDFYSVALVKADQCSSVFTDLSSLKGAESCHGRYHDTAGWTLPLGRLLQGNPPLLDFSDGQLESALPNGISADASAATAFFAEDGICAPGRTDNGPLEDEDGEGVPWPPICKEGCKGASNEDISEDQVCQAGESSKNAYDTDKGAIQCLVDKYEANPEAVVVAFVKHDSFSNHKDDEDTQNWGRENQYKILCDSGCKNLEEYSSCNLGQSPPRAIVANEDFGRTELGKQFFSLVARPESGFLEKAKQLKGNSEDDESSQEVQLISNEADKLEVIDPSLSFKGGFFESYDQFDKAWKLGQRPVYFCIPLQPDNTAEFEARCTDSFKRFNRDVLEWKCKVGNNAEGCMQMVKDGSAQVTKLGGESLFTAHVEYGLQPILAEKYDQTGNGNIGASAFSTYKAVAVMKKDTCNRLKDEADENSIDHVFKALEGKKSCFASYGRAADWSLPVGTLMSLGLLPTQKESGVKTDAASVAAFFSGVCAPGTTEDGPRIGEDEGEKHDKLCSICKDGDCTEESEYEGYHGALQCVLDDEGDVAWVQHTTALERPESQQDQLQILCPGASGDNRCRNVDAWTDCAYASAPGSAFVGRQGWKDTLAGKEVIKSLTYAAEDPVFLEATSADDLEDYPMQKSAMALEEVEDPSDFESVFGTEAFQAYSSIKAANGDGGDQDAEVEDPQGGERPSLVQTLLLTFSSSVSAENFADSIWGTTRLSKGNGYDPCSLTANQQFAFEYLQSALSGSSAEDGALSFEVEGETVTMTTQLFYPMGTDLESIQGVEAANAVAAIFSDDTEPNHPYGCGDSGGGGGGGAGGGARRKLLAVNENQYQNSIGSSGAMTNFNEFQDQALERSFKLDGEGDNGDAQGLRASLLLGVMAAAIFAFL